MMELIQPGHVVAAAAGVGVIYALYRIAKSNRDIRRELADVKASGSRRMTELQANISSLYAQVSGKTDGTALSALSRRVTDIELARRNERRAGGDLQRAVDAFADSRSSGQSTPIGRADNRVTSAGGTITSQGSSTTNRNSSRVVEETPLSSPLHPANPLNPAYAVDDSPSRSSSHSSPSYDDCGSSRSSSSSYGCSSSSSSDSCSSGDSGSCSSSD